MEVERVKNDIIKGAVVKALELSQEELEKINAMTVRPLTKEEVFVFKVVMCDNKIDRAGEAFTQKALDELAQKFVGRPMISDHKRSAAGQVARIYDTQVLPAQGDTGTGEPYHQLIAKCYMLRTDSSRDLIAEIEAGIKKEVSVSCAVGKVICSICGADNRKTYCRHYPGQEYEGQTCYFALDGALDAYELSFVAVPCQPAAGVTKAYGPQKPEHWPEEEGQKKKNKLTLALKMAQEAAFLAENHRG